MLSEGGRRPDFNDSLQVVQERAEGPKALSPGQRPGYTSNQQCALQGQKLYITLYHRQPSINTSGLIYTSSRSLHSSITADSLLTIKSYNSWSISA